MSRDQLWGKTALGNCSIENDLLHPDHSHCFYKPALNWFMILIHFTHFLLFCSLIWKWYFAGLFSWCLYHGYFALKACVTMLKIFVDETQFEHCQGLMITNVFNLFYSLKVCFTLSESSQSSVGRLEAISFLSIVYNCSLPPYSQHSQHTIRHDTTIAS